MSKEQWVFRHSHKLSYYPEKWKKHARFKENPFDEPLTPFGMQLATRCGKFISEKSKALREGRIKFIYCSPFTRCMQTAIQIIKVVKKTLNHNLKIVVVYDLGESLLGRDTVSIKNGKIKLTKAKYATFYGSRGKWTSTVDKKMEPAGLEKRFGEYIEGCVYSKLGIENWGDESKRMFKAIKAISNKTESSIIVGHAHTLDLAFNYFANPSEPLTSYTFGGPNNVCTVMGFSCSEKDKWKIIQKPKVP